MPSVNRKAGGSSELPSYRKVTRGRVQSQMYLWFARRSLMASAWLVLDRDLRGAAGVSCLCLATLLKQLGQ